MVNYKTWLCSSWLFYKLAFNVVNFSLWCSLCLGIVNSKTSSLFIGAVWHFSAICLNNDVRSWCFFGMHPDIISLCELKGQFFILVVVFSNIDIKAIRRKIVIRNTFSSIVLSPFWTMRFNITAFSKLSANFIKIYITCSDIN